MFVDSPDLFSLVQREFISRSYDIVVKDKDCEIYDLGKQLINEMIPMQKPQRDQYVQLILVTEYHQLLLQKPITGVVLLARDLSRKAALRNPAVRDLYMRAGLLLVMN